jgi:hypothetical protein
MKKILNYSIVLFATLAIGFSSCKDEETTPSTTPTAKTDVFNCKVNGTAWESNSRSTMVPFLDSMIPSVNASVEADTLSMMAFKTTSTDSTMILFSVLLKNPRVGTYTMTGTDYNIYYFTGIDFMTFLNTFFGYTSSSTLNITKFDATNKKISGTFNTTMTSTSGAPTMTITEGTFNDVTLTIK